jgi:hypothetical protein
MNDALFIVDEEYSANLRIRLWNGVSSAVNGYNHNISKFQFVPEFRYCCARLAEWAEEFSRNPSNLVEVLVKIVVYLSWQQGDFVGTIKLYERRDRDSKKKERGLLRRIKKQDAKIRALQNEVTALNSAASSLSSVDPNSFQWNVYFLQSSANGLIKIGKSHQGDRRISNLRTLSPVPLLFVGGILAEDNHESEQNLHKQFAYCRHHGEWFVPDQKLVNYISEINAEHAPKAAA